MYRRTNYTLFPAFVAVAVAATILKFFDADPGSGMEKKSKNSAPG